MTANRWFRITLAGACALTLLLLLLGLAPGAKAAFHLGDRHALRLAVVPRVVVLGPSTKVDSNHGGPANQAGVHRYPRRAAQHHHGSGGGHKPPTEAPTPPAEETKPPVEETKPPVEEAKPPVEEAKPPVEEAKPPVEETEPPVEEAKPPVTEPPVEETKPPVEEEPVTPPADTTPPQTTIETGPSATTTSTTASLAFSASEAGSTFECQLDGAEWAACSSPRSYSTLAVGAHSFAARAIDVAKNVDPTPATWSWTVSAPESGGGPTGSAPCTQTLATGANVSTAITNAPAGSVVCLPPGATSFSISQVNKSSTVTVRGTGGTVGYSAIRKSSNLRFEGIRFTGGLELLGATSGIQIVNNDFTGTFGIHAGGEAHTFAGSKVSNVLIEGNSIHDLNYTGSQGSANGYGITASDGVANFTIRGNTIKSPASDYIQSASPVNFIVDHNTFLGPSLLGSHEDHQDLWQIFGGGTNITFTNNVARNTETQESLLFQEGAFQNVVVENNLFDHDSRGYTCQLYQSKGLVFRNNTIVGSHWGCLFRDLASSAAGSGYEIDHNVFVGTAEGGDISTEGRAGSWGSYDYNVSEDGSASGTHSVRNWKPTWADATNYVPSGLPFTAGFRP